MLYEKLGLFFNFVLVLCMLIGIWSNLVYPLNLMGTIWIMVIVALFFILKKHFKTKPHIANLLEKKSKWITLLMFSMMLCIQLITLLHFKTNMYHDPFRVLYQAELLSHGIIDWDKTIYFQVYPNNVTLTVLLAGWLKITQFFHISANISVHLLTLITLDIFILLCLKLVKDVSKTWRKPMFVMLFFLITPLAYTYLLQVFYSDIIGLISLTASLLILVNWNKVSTKLKVFLGILLVFVTCIGQLVKPNLLVFEIAFLITVLLFKLAKKNIKLFIPFLLTLVGCISAPLVTTQIQERVNFTGNGQYELPVTSWIYMGLNQKTVGTYAEDDIFKLEKSSNLSERKQTTQKLIEQRIKKMGPLKLIKQWVGKIEILENVGTLQGSYMGGTSQAPIWFLKNQPFLSGTFSVIFRSAIIIIMISVILKALAISQKRYFNWQWILFTLTILGIVAFHGLLWETEARYGLLLIPIYFTLLAFPERQVELKHLNKSFIWWGLLILVFPLWNLISGNVSANIEINPHIVSEQRSQLSEKYQAPIAYIHPNETITERVNLNCSAETFSLLAPQNSKLEGTLINVTTHKTYKLHLDKKSLQYTGHLTSGKYLIKLTNLSDKKQKVWIVNPLNYRLAQYPLKASDQNIKNGYFIYKFEDQR